MISGTETHIRDLMIMIMSLTGAVKKKLTLKLIIPVDNKISKKMLNTENIVYCLTGAWRKCLLVGLIYGPNLP